MPKMPYSTIWLRNLSMMYGDQKANALITRAQEYYDNYCIRHLAETHQANRKTLKMRVFPGMSIYKALLDENDDRKKVLAEVDILFREAFFITRMKGIRLLNYFPDPFPIVKPALKMMTRDEYVPGSQVIIEDSKDCFALNVYRCFILDTLTRHHAKELTALYCNTDDWLAEALPKISWERTMTLGRGGTCCDFRWRRSRAQI